MKRIKLTVAYEGTKYSGWQFQLNSITIEEVLNRELSSLTGEEIKVTGASRTDAGVHAMGNVAVFDTESRIPAEKFCYALNQRLPGDIVIQSSKEVPLNFHPRHCDSIKTYEYRILNARHPRPLLRHYTYFMYAALDVGQMNAAAAYLVGEHDFKSFCSAHAQVKGTVRTIYSANVFQEEDIITIRIAGNGFLYNMVRIIAGTLILVGQGKYPPDRLDQILKALNRTESGPTAPAVGLMLSGITYPNGDDKLII